MLRTDTSSTSSVLLGRGFNSVTGEMINQTVFKLESASSKDSEKKPSTDTSAIKIEISLPEKAGAKEDKDAKASSIQEPKPAAKTPDTGFKIDVGNRRVTESVQFFDSLSELQTEFDTSLSATVPSSGTSIGLNISSIKKQSTHEIYYVLHLSCQEGTRYFDTSSPLKPGAFDLLTSPAVKSSKKPKKDENKEPLTSPDLALTEDKHRLKNIKKFFAQYGDSFIDSITYGRWATVIIRIKADSLEKKQQISANLSQATGPATGDASAAYSLV